MSHTIGYCSLKIELGPNLHNTHTIQAHSWPMNVVFKHYRLNEFHCRIEQSGTIKRGEIRANKDDHTSSLLHLRQGNPNFQKTQFIRGKVVCFALVCFLGFRNLHYFCILKCFWWFFVTGYWKQVGYISWSSSIWLYRRVKILLFPPCDKSIFLLLPFILSKVSKNINFRMFNCICTSISYNQTCSTFVCMLILTSIRGKYYIIRLFQCSIYLH